LILSTVVLAGLILWNAFRPPEPKYLGRTVTEWLDRLESSESHSFDGIGCETAFQELGTNALPVFLRYLVARDGSLRERAVGLINGQKLVRVHFKTAAERRGQIYLAISYLGTNAWSAVVPQLTKLMSNSDVEIRRYALGCFANIYLEKTAWLAVMTNCLVDSSPDIRKYAFDRIALRYPEDKFDFKP